MPRCAIWMVTGTSTSMSSPFRGLTTTLVGVFPIARYQHSTLWSMRASLVRLQHVGSSPQGASSSTSRRPVTRVGESPSVAHGGAWTRWVLSVGFNIQPTIPKRGRLDVPPSRGSAGRSLSASARIVHGRRRTRPDPQRQRSAGSPRLQAIRLPRWTRPNPHVWPMPEFKSPLRHHSPG